MNPLEGHSSEKGRRESYTNQEALCLEKVWVTQSIYGANKKDSTTWDGIKLICTDKYSKDRSNTFLRCTWARLAREIQH